MALALSVVIPTLDEAERIGDVIESARRALGDAAEIIVVDGGSGDGTAALAAAAGARVLHADRGRGVQMRAGVEAATGEVVVLLHADTRLPAGARAAIEDALRDPAVSGGAFQLTFHAEHGAVPRTLRVYARWLSARSRLFGIASGDQAIFARAAALRVAGGVPAIPLFEDVRVYRALRRAGRVHVVAAAVSTSPRLFLKAGPMRIILLHTAFRVLHAFGVAPATLDRWYPTRATGKRTARS